MKIDELTPVEYNEETGIWLKRDDLFEVYGVRGGKARSAYQVILKLIEEGYREIVTAGSRQSPQCEIVSYICENMGLKCRVFMPYGEDTSVISHIQENQNTIIERVRPGYNNVIIARAREYAENRNVGYVPYGMECAENIEVTCSQVKNLPVGRIKRVVVPVGSGMSISSVITGMTRNGLDLPLLGVRVGRSPDKIIEKYAEGVGLSNLEIVSASKSYHTVCEEYVDGYQLDPIYEAKCREFLQEGDLLWVVGKRLMDV